MKVLAQTFERLEPDALCDVKLRHVLIALIKISDLIVAFQFLFSL